ncbi:MAG: GAF domain-containing protein [Polyangiaceae bacterium]
MDRTVEQRGLASAGSAQAQVDSLRKRVAALEAAHAECDARIRELSDQNTSLVQLTVASQLLTASLEREDVLSAIEEVVVNMVGSEEFAIFDLDIDGQSLRVARARGIDPRGPRMRLAGGAMRHAMSSGRTLVIKRREIGGETDGGLTAAIPLRIESQATGVIAVFRLLEQKAGLDPTDLELFEVLSRQAAMALYTTAYRSLRPTVRPPVGDGAPSETRTKIA